MKNFTVRVELHGNDPNYDLLREKMEEAGFSRTIKSGKGTVYHLPDAEYNYRANISRGIVLDRAYAIATRIKRQPSVIVTESVGRTWKGLDKA